MERFVSVYGPSNEYLHCGIVQTLVQLLDDAKLYYETGCLLSILYLPEYLPTSGDMEACMSGAVALLLKHLILSAPNSSRTAQSHFENYTFVLAQLTHFSYVQLLIESNMI